MKASARKQKCTLTAMPDATHDLKTKCVTMLVYEEKGKTILQPVATEQETPTIQELFQNNTLEVWLSNGKSDAEEYAVSILQYKPQIQQSGSTNTIKQKQALSPLSQMGKNRLKGFWRFHS